MLGILSFAGILFLWSLFLRIITIQIVFRNPSLFIISQKVYVVKSGLWISLSGTFVKNAGFTIIIEYQ